MPDNKDEVPNAYAPTKQDATTVVATDARDKAHPESDPGQRPPQYAPEAKLADGGEAPKGNLAEEVERREEARRNPEEAVTQGTEGEGTQNG